MLWEVSYWTLVRGGMMLMLILPFLLGKYKTTVINQYRYGQRYFKTVVTESVLGPLKTVFSCCFCFQSQTSRIPRAWLFSLWVTQRNTFLITTRAEPRVQSLRGLFHQRLYLLSEDPPQRSLELAVGAVGVSLGEQSSFGSSATPVFRKHACCVRTRSSVNTEEQHRDTYHRVTGAKPLKKEGIKQFAG